MSDSVLQRIVRVIAQTFDADPTLLGSGTVAEDVPGWDSLSHTILTLSIEEEFGITLPPDARSFADVGELAERVKALVEGRR